MSVGIYKITNIINQHCYVGQSRRIEARWLDHKENSQNVNAHSYNYPLYKAFRKYGIENFTFEILEECSIDELNDKEVYWINTLQPYYNQTIGGNFRVTYQKLTYDQVKEIQQLLIADIEGKISHVDLANQYNVSKDTIRDINVGRTWFDDNLTYPLHYSKFDSKKGYSLSETYCIDCGKPIGHQHTRCLECENKRRREKALSELPVSRDTLKNLIRTTTFTAIAQQYNVSDKTIRKWCIKYNLPSKVSIIKTISDKDWETI